MSSAKLHLRLTCIALTISLSLAADWVSGPWFDIDSPLVRWSLFLLNLTLTAASLAYLLGQVWATQNAAMRELELLCGADIRELAAAKTFSSLPADSSWVAVLTRVHQRLATVGDRLQELEQQRAALESRSKRNEDHAQRMNSVLSGLAEPVIAIDKYEELVLTNPSAEELFSIGPAKTEARALSKLVQCQKLVELLRETRKRKVSSQRTCEVELSDSHGLAHWYRVTARNIPSQGGPTDSDSGSQGVVAVLHDISLQKTIQKRNAEFVSAVSHEMKTPLAGIKAYVELLVDGDAEDVKTQEEFLEIINAQADRLQRLVDNMLNLARIEAGVVSVNKQSRSLNELLEEALRVIHPAAETKGITLKSDLSPMYLPVLVDRDMALQAAINLLSNAVKYTPPGGQVTLRSRLIGNELRFDVEDNGVGLSAEDCQKVFEKFYRVQKDKQMAAGTGLGLPLVKQIVEDVHGGKIAVQSTLGKGSVFSVFLPSAGQIT
ncbi:MAG: hypothetical protein HY288_01085 [Planctomycetia bacterium]|nr:hypothetical protein [Planctomycetia bacterium]